MRDASGQKMSKTKGNVIDPLDVVDQFGSDALRYSLVTGSTPGQDVPLSMERIESNRSVMVCCGVMCSSELNCAMLCSLLACTASCFAALCSAACFMTSCYEVVEKYNYGGTPGLRETICSVLFSLFITSQPSSS